MEELLPPDRFVVMKDGNYWSGFKWVNSQLVRSYDNNPKNAYSLVQRIEPLDGESIVSTDAVNHYWALTKTMNYLPRVFWQRPELFS